MKEQIKELKKIIQEKDKNYSSLQDENQKTLREKERLEAEISKLNDDINNLNQINLVLSSKMSNDIWLAQDNSRLNAKVEAYEKVIDSKILNKYED